MAFYIVIKNSTNTAVPADSDIVRGELAYSFATGDSDNGDRLYIGDENGQPIPIGGTYYTNMMDHPKGQVHPGSVIITDNSGKINKLNVDNVRIDNNTITSTAGGLILSGNNDTVGFNNNRLTNVDTPVDGTDAVNKDYVDQAAIFDINADANISGTGQVASDELLKINGGFNTNTERRDVVGGVQVKVQLDSDVLGLSRLTVDNTFMDGNRIGTTSGNLEIISASGTVYIQDNLVVNGTTTTLNSTELLIDDKNITLASGAINAAAADSAGINVDGANANIFYKASNDTWNFNKKIIAPNVDVTGTISSTTFSGEYLGFDSDFALKTTDDLPEGDSNLYYTSARADSDARHALDVSDNGGDGSLTYDRTTGVFRYTGPSSAEVRAHFSAAGDLVYNESQGQFSIDVEATYTKANFDSDLAATNTNHLPEGSTNLYYTTARADSDFDARFATKTTDDVPEGTSNLYYTDERVDDRVAAALTTGEAIDIVYDDDAGTIRVSAEHATDTNIGVAAFDSVDFLVTAGQVEIATIDCGLY